MKKWIALFLAICILLPFSACSQNAGPAKPSATPTPNASNADEPDLDLNKLVSSICDGVDVPYYEIIPLDQGTFEQFAFIPWENGIEAVAADATIGSIAHSLVLIKTQNQNASALAEKIATHADPRKWICVEAETGAVLHTQTYVLLLMTFEDDINALCQNFQKAMGNVPVEKLPLTGENLPVSPMN